MLQSVLTFQSPPFGIITIQKGQLGYKRQTRIRLRSKKGQIYFKIKGGKKYVQDPNNGKKFHLV